MRPSGPVEHNLLRLLTRNLGKNRIAPVLALVARKRGRARTSIIFLELTALSNISEGLHEDLYCMPSILAAVGTIQAHVAPVVFLDTCVLLDIIRAPLRNASLTVQAATELLTGAQRVSPTVYLVIGCPTPTEWNDHVVDAVTDCSIAGASARVVR
jgi:hypothetical protein